MARNYLVTGGAGFIGSHIVEALLAAGDSVRVADNFSTGKRKNIEPLLAKIDLVEGDLADEGVAARACRDIDGVFHEAAIPSVPRSVKDPFPTQRAGEIATLKLLDACVQAKVRRVVFAASSSVYGETETLPKIESMPPQPLSPYAASKLACEGYIRAYAHCHGLDGIALRYFNVFGPRQDPSSPYSGVISVFVDLMKTGKRPTINGDGSQTRDFTYVENVVSANLKAMHAEKQLKGVVCNAACGERVSLNDLVATLNRELGTNLKPTYGPPRTGDVRHSLAEISLARELFGYVPLVRFNEGIRRLIAWRGV